MQIKEILCTYILLSYFFFGFRGKSKIYSAQSFVLVPLNVIDLYKARKF
jgi:hypothetical protein